jgi:Tfp pilus assembly PilM family ATPase
MPRFLAIDWDQNQLHVVAAEVRAGSVKVQRALVWAEERSPNAADAEALGKHLRERLREAGITPAPVLVSVGRDRVILKDIRHPPVPEADEAALVRFQAVKELTEPPDEVIIDYTPVGDRSVPGERRALAVVVRRDIVATWRNICHAAGLRLEGVTPRPFGIAAAWRSVAGRTALTPAPAAAGDSVAVAVVGERWAEFAVTRGAALLLARTLTVGPGLAGEVRRNLALYAGQGGQQAVSGLYLAGAITPDLRERLGDMLPDVPLHPFDPFAGLELPDVQPISRGAFAGALGLLHARSERGGLPINFVQPRQPKPPADNKRQLVLAGFAAFVLLFGGTAFAGYYLKQGREVELNAVIAEREEAEAETNQTKEGNKRLKALEEWDTAVTLDELYDLTHRIADVNKLRVKDLTFEATGRQARSKFAAKMTIKVELVDARSPEERGAGGFGPGGGGFGPGARGPGRRGPDLEKAPLNAMLKEFQREGYYTVESKLDGNEATITVHIERRPPSKYTRAMDKKDAL